jgi:hypothetical protein
MEKENNPQIAPMNADKEDENTFAIIGAAMAVHNELGCGFLEAVYLKANYRADFICYESVIVELKALNSLSGNEDSQVINYLKASGVQRALLINFGRPKHEYKRLVFNYR